MRSIILMLLMVLCGCEQPMFCGATRFKRDKSSGYIIYVEEPCFDYPYHKNTIWRDGTVYEMQKERWAASLIDYKDANLWCSKKYGNKIRKYNENKNKYDEAERERIRADDEDESDDSDHPCVCECKCEPCDCSSISKWDVIDSPLNSVGW